MPGIFEICFSDLKSLKPLPLTELVKKLVSMEASRQCIPQTGLACNLEITAPDGGDDITIDSQMDPISKDGIPNRKTLYQCKATSVTKTSAAKEVLTKNKQNVKPRVDAVLSAGGAYILCTTKAIANKDKDIIVESIRSSFRKLAKPYANTADIFVFDSNKLADWSNLYISIIAQIQTQLGRPLSATIKPWKEWQEYSDHKISFISNVTLSGYITSLRNHLATPMAVARIVGLSGIGKTRLALETFRPPANPKDNLSQFALSSGCVYTDAESTQNILGLLSEWIRQGLRGVIIVDNCDSNLHSQLQSEITRTSSLLSLLTLDYRINDCSFSHPLIKLESAAAVTSEILTQAYPTLSPSDISRIVTLADGFPRMAVLFANAHLDKASNIGYLDNQALINRILWQGDTPTEVAKKTIDSCALFAHIGFEDNVSKQRIFVAESIAKVDKDEFYTHVEYFIKHNVIDRCGRFIKVVPFPLALTLAAQWWETCSPEKASALLSNVPLDMAQALYDQLRYLEFVPRAKDITAELVGNNGPFGHAEVLLSTQGSRLFRCLVEINPEPCLNALQNAIGELSQEDILLIGSARRNLVWSLENLCFWNSTFPGAARLMLSLAAAENETWANNATNQFLQLYHIYLSGTQAPPSVRLEIVDEALSTDCIEKRILAVRALGSALKMNHFMRTAGSDHQGSRVPERDWAPKSHEEVFDYLDACIKRLTEISCSSNLELATLGKKEFGQRLRGLIMRCRDTTLADSIRAIATISKGFWPEAVSQLRDSLEYEGSEMTSETSRNIQLWLTWLTPSELKERLRLIVSIPNFENRRDNQGKFVDIAEENAISLAQELAPSLDLLIPFLPILVTGEQRQAYTFGKELAIHVEEPNTLAEQMLESLRSVPDDTGNPSILCGFLFTLASKNRELVTKVLTQTASDPALIKYLIELTRLSRPMPVDLKRVVDAVKEKRISSDRLYAFSYNSVVDHLPTNEVIDFCDTICALNLAGVACAMQILYMYCFQNPPRFTACFQTFRRYMLNNGILVEINNRPGFCGHSWQEIARSLLVQTKNDTYLAEFITKDIVCACLEENFPYDAKYYVSPILELMLKNYAANVWPHIGDGLLSTDRRQRHNLMHLFDDLGEKLKAGLVITSIPLGLLLDWCKEHEPEGPRAVARIIPVIKKNNENNSHDWHPFARAFIDAFGTDKSFLSELSGNFLTYTWSGSIVPYYQIQVELMESLLSHKLLQVRTWANKSITQLKEDIKREEGREQERDLGVYIT